MMRVALTERSPWFAVLLVSTVHVAGCATIVTGGHQSVTFNSNPDGATVTLDGTVMGRTPMTLSLKKKAGQTLAFEREGYQPLTTQLRTTTNPWILGNILIGGLLGCSTDVVSGALYKYAPDRYMVTLQPTAATAAAGPSAVIDAPEASPAPAAHSDQIATLESHTTLTSAQKQKDYIVRTYDALLEDLKHSPAAKPGEHLSALLSLLNIRPNQQYDAIKRIRAMSVEYPDPVQFADHVIEAFGS